MFEYCGWFIKRVLMMVGREKEIMIYEMFSKLILSGLIILMFWMRLLLWFVIVFGIIINLLIFFLLIFFGLELWYNVFVKFLDLYCLINGL